MDYNSSIDRDVLEDISTLCQQADTGSVVIVTINANKNSLPKLDSDGKKLENLRDQLHYCAGDLIPQELPIGVEKASQFPSFLASIFFDHMRRNIQSAGRENDLMFPLLNIVYRDGTPMIVVGAVIAKNSEIQQIKTTVNSWNQFWLMDEDKQLQICVPTLTLKEKSSLDPINAM